MSTDLEQAAELARTDIVAAEQAYRRILESKPSNENVLRDQETALVRLGALYRDQGNFQELGELVKLSRTHMPSTAKAKTAKLIRSLIDFYPPSARDAQMSITQDSINWARDEKRVFLRQSLEIKLVGLQLDAGSHQPALNKTEELLKELKMLDDKIILTEVFLLESRAAHALQNLPRAKAALTAARTTANSIYCPPLLQATLDLQAGALNADEHDYKTAYSYFFEAFEGFTAQDDKRALPSLKYMLLCKIMLNLPDDVAPLLLLKSAAAHAGADLDAMKAMANALQERSLDLFQKTLKDFTEQLQQDPLIRSHLSLLYDTLLEQNLVRVIEPYSSVELSYVASEVGQALADVEQKLSQMILDKVFHGVLDESAGTLEVYDEPKEDPTYTTSLETLKQMGGVVSGLYEKATRLQ